MKDSIGLDQWIYALVEKTPDNERIIGQHDTEHDIRFIPIYMDRDAARLGAAHLAIEKSYEIQAIIYEDLLQYAALNQSLVFLMDGRGALLSKIAPDGRAV